MGARGGDFVHIKIFSLHESGAVVPLLISASAPWCPSYTDTGHASHKNVSKTVKFGGCSPALMWGM